MSSITDFSLLKPRKTFFLFYFYSGKLLFHSGNSCLGGLDLFACAYSDGKNSISRRRRRKRQNKISSQFYFYTVGRKKEGRKRKKVGYSI